MQGVSFCFFGRLPAKSPRYHARTGLSTLHGSLFQSLARATMQHLGEPSQFFKSSNFSCSNHKTVASLKFFLMNKIEHLGIAVRDAEKSKILFAKLLNTPAYKSETVESEYVNTHFFRLGPNKVELLEAIDGQGAIGKYLEKNGEGLHHIAISVDDILAEMKRLQSEGFVFIYDKPKSGADNKIINFIHPKSANGMLVELCQEAK